jgi:hypothetical protein
VDKYLCFIFSFDRLLFIQFEKEYSKMEEIKDYTEEREYSHYNGVPSAYGRRVDEQCRMQPKYCWPGEADGEMRGEKRNEQKGP